MAGHKGPASLRPRCTRGGSSVAVIPVYNKYRLQTDTVHVMVSLRRQILQLFTNLNVGSFTNQKCRGKKYILVNSAFENSVTSNL
jgi:hypothetical protein